MSDTSGAQGDELQRAVDEVAGSASAQADPIREDKDDASDASSSPTRGPGSDGPPNPA